MQALEITETFSWECDRVVKLRFSEEITKKDGKSPRRALVKMVA